MSNDTNIVILKGNLGKNPEARFFSNGSKVVNFPIAVKRWIPGRDGQEGREEVSWFDINVFGKETDYVLQFQKGTKVILEGELRQERWTDKNSNQERSRVIVVALSVEAVNIIKQQQQQSTEQASSQYGQSQQKYPSGSYQTQKQQYIPLHPIDNSDIPPLDNNMPF